MTKVSCAGVALFVTMASCGSPPEPAEPAAQPPAVDEAAPSVEDATPRANAPAVEADEAETPSEPAPSEAPSDSAQKERPPGKTVEETRTSEVIKGVVDRNRESVRRCFDALSREQKGNGGMLTIAFKLGPKGDVKSARLNDERSTLKYPELVSCAVDAIKALKFPPSSRGFESNVNFPFNFKP